MADIKRNNKNNFKRKTRKPIEQKKKRSSIVIPADTNKCGYIEYNMPQAMYETLIKKEKKIGNIQEFLCNYVNTSFGLKGFCVRVNIF